MKTCFPSLLATASALLLTGCLTTPTADSGGLGSITVPNTNPTAIIAAAQSVFAQSGYQRGVVNYPTSVSFDKPASGFGSAMWGSFDSQATVRVKVLMNQESGTGNYVLSTRVYSVTNAGEAGFADATRRSGLWSAEFKPLLRQVQTQAAGAGPGI